MPTSFETLRRGPRVRVSIPASYESSQLSVDGRVTDLSAEGLFLSTSYLDAQGEKARVQVRLPEEALELRGEVRWVRETPLGAGMGIKLVDVSLDDRARLSALMAGLGSDPAADVGISWSA